MLRGFLVIFLLSTIAVIAVFGYRGQKSTQPPTEVFPDMVRQMKVRAQAPLDFFADGRGPRLPVAGTVPIGYEMPKPMRLKTSRLRSVPGHTRMRVSASSPITTTPARWAITGGLVFPWK